MLKLFPRLGCPFTRCDAQLLNQQRGRLEEVGATLVGICFEENRESRLGGLWDGQLYTDPQRAAYRYFRLQRLSRLWALHYLAQHDALKPRTITPRNLLSSLRKGFAASIVQMGGTFVINAEGHVLYSHVQDNPRDLTNTADVYKACHNEYMFRMLAPVENHPATTTRYNGSRRKCLANIPAREEFLLYKQTNDSL